MKISILIGLVLLSIISISQEVTTIGGFNALEKPIALKSNDTIKLPFIEDFSVIDSFSLHFKDNYVNISYSASKNPPSVGVAMFDALDENGNFYASGYNASITADILTSKPIDLYYPNENSIYFSFYYQPKGYLDLPEKNDSLVLQFYAPNQKKWNTVWFAHNPSENQKFRAVNIHVSDTSYIQKGFQFRFYNHISMASGTFPSRVSNCDHWFVDYIYLNKNRTQNDTFPNDVAIQTLVDLKIGEYQSIPYKHYKENPETRCYYKINLRNNYYEGIEIDSINFYFQYKNTSLEDEKIFAGSTNLSGYLSYPYTKTTYDIHFPSTSYDELNYNLKTRIVTNSQDPVFNNTVNQHKEFSVFYAYDDGTAENGYGLLGTGTLFAYVAQKYYTYSDDYLTGFQIFLNKTFKDAQPYYFYAVVWDSDDENAKPGTILYEQEGIEIDFDKRNNFQTIIFDEPVAVSDTFYIGWMKTYEEMMNIGLDLNYSGENKKYYNIYGDWQKSTVPGILMIRPVFGSAELASVVKIGNQINVFPNPTDGIVNIDFLNDLSDKNEIFICDYTGKILLHDESCESNYSFDLSHYPTGIYILKVVSENHAYSSKIIKK